MSKNRLPYYKAYPRDFIEGTIGMSFEAKACYRLVLDLIYMQSGKLKDDAHYICGLLGCSKRKWTALRIELICLGKIQVESGFISNFRATFELESYAKLQDKNTENGLKPKKNNDLKKDWLRQPEPEPEPYNIDTKVSIAISEKSPSKKASKGTRMQEGWEPSDQDVQHAFTKGLSNDATRDQAERFRDYWLSKAGAGGVKLDWAATWRNWVASYCERQAKGGGQRPTGHRQEPTSRADIAIQRVKASQGMGADWRT